MTSPTRYPEHKKKRRTKTTLRATNGMEVRVIITHVSIVGWWAGSTLYSRRFWKLVTP